MALHKNIKILTWFNFFTDFRLYAPIAIIYFAQVTGSYALGMSIFSIIFISSALFEIPTGVFSDYIGRKQTTMLGALAAVIYSIFFAIGQSYWILVIGALFEGLSRSFYSGNDNALLHETLAQTGEEHKYEEYLGKVSSMFQLALAISALLGSFLVHWSFSLIMWLSVIPQIVCFVLATQLQEPKVHTKDSGNIYQHLGEAMRGFITNKKLRLLSVSSILSFGLGEAGYQFQAAFYGTLWPVWAIGLAKMISNLTATFSFHFSGAVNRRFGTIKVLFFGEVGTRLLQTVAVSMPTFLSPLLISVTSIFYGVTSTSKSALMQKEFRSEQRATMGSLNSFAGSIFFGIVSFILGYTADQLSPGKALLILQICLLPVMFIYWILFKDNTTQRRI